MNLKNVIFTYIGKYLNEQANRDNIQNLTIYSVTFETNDSTDSIYFGLDKDEAFYEYNNFNDVPERWFNRPDLSVQLSKKVNQYEFIHELDSESETIEDYPIEEYYDDTDVYELVNEGDFTLIEFREIKPKNELSDELLNDVSSYFQKKYKNFKYNTIKVHDENDEYKGCIQLRITDHTENIHNIDRYNSCDYHISVVISDYDATRQKFGMTNAFERRKNEFELTFSSEDDFSNVIREIENQIDECQENLLLRR